MNCMYHEIDEIYLKEMDDTEPEEMTMEVQITGTDLSVLQDRSIKSREPLSQPSAKTEPPKPHPYPSRPDAIMSSSVADATCYSGADASQVLEFTAEHCHQYFNKVGNIAGFEQRLSNIEKNPTKNCTDDLYDFSQTQGHKLNNNQNEEDQLPFDNQLEEQMLSFFADNTVSRIEVNEFLNCLKNDKPTGNDLSSVHDSTFIRNKKMNVDSKQLT